MTYSCVSQHATSSAVLLTQNIKNQKDERARDISLRNEIKDRGGVAIPVWGHILIVFNGTSRVDDIRTWFFFPVFKLYTTVCFDKKDTPNVVKSNIRGVFKYCVFIYTTRFVSKNFRVTFSLPLPDTI